MKEPLVLHAEILSTRPNSELPSILRSPINCQQKTQSLSSPASLFFLETEVFFMHANQHTPTITGYTSILNNVFGTVKQRETPPCTKSYNLGVRWGYTMTVPNFFYRGNSSQNFRIMQCISDRMVGPQHPCFPSDTGHFPVTFFPFVSID